MTVKDRAIEAIKTLPDDADFQSILKRIDFIQAVDKGLAEADRGELLTAEQARECLQRWISE